MTGFPVHLLSPLYAEIVEVGGELARYSFIDVNFKGIADSEIDGMEFDPLLRLGYVRLPTKNLSELAGKSFDFPTECELNGFYPGDDKYDCIEGSIYFAHAGQPIYVSKLEFGVISEGKMPLKIETKWDFNPDAVGFEGFEYNFIVPLLVKDAPLENSSKSGFGGFLSRFKRG